MALCYEISAEQIRGDRASQEDAYLTTNLGDEKGGRPTSSLVTMADGMGGHAGGEIASNLVVSTFNKSFAHQFDSQNIPKILGDCLDKANSALAENIRKAPELSGMGCTMVSVVLSDGKLWWTSVGDSHLYLIRDRRLSKLNDDHSYGAFLDQMQAHGMDMGLSPGLSRNMLVSAITGDEITAIDCPVKPRELKSGDRIIVASDGLDTLARETIARISASASDPSACVQSLLQTVEDAGKAHQDNTTIIAIDVFGHGAEAAVRNEEQDDSRAAVSSPAETKSDSADPESVDGTESETPSGEASAGEDTARPSTAKAEERSAGADKSGAETPDQPASKGKGKPSREPKGVPSGAEEPTKPGKETSGKARVTSGQKKSRISEAADAQAKSSGSVASLDEKRAERARGLTESSSPETPKPYPKSDSLGSSSKAGSEPPILEPLSPSQLTTRSGAEAKSGRAGNEPKAGRDGSADFDPESTLPLEVAEERPDASTLPDSLSGQRSSSPGESGAIPGGDDVAETLAFARDTQSETDSVLELEPQEPTEPLNFDDVFDDLDHAKSAEAQPAKVPDTGPGETPSERRGKGMLLGIAATVLIGIGVGAFLLKDDGAPESAETATGTPETVAAAGTSESTVPPQGQPTAGEEPDSTSGADPQEATPEVADPVDSGAASGEPSVPVEAEPTPQEPSEPENVTGSANQSPSESETDPRSQGQEPVAVPPDEPPADVTPPEPTEPVESVPDTTTEVATPSMFRDPLAVGGQGPQMVSIPGGTFAMGSGGMTASADEYPRHDVTVPPFAISQHEITVAEYAKFAKATGRRLPKGVSKRKGKQPIVSVTWKDAVRYTEWLSKQTGKKYRLPSEAEWEYAASTGKRSPHWWGYEVPQGQAHCFGCNGSAESRGPVEVGRFPPNPFGLHDTAGNVMEWVADCYHPNYQGAPDNGQPWEGGDCSYRMVRGGAYNSPPPSIRTAKRAKRKSGRGYDTVGIRVVREQ